jgi:AraC family transcriptional regulator, 4-hydroxyphenylacetate 3-monooxygenase operon regulatory protein
MAKTIPIFQDHDETYRADSCLPLVGARGRGTFKLDALTHGHYPGRMLPPVALPSLKTVGYWDAAEDQNWGLPWHRNEGIELTFLEGGSLHCAVEHHEYRLQPDDLTITRPWQLHRIGNPYVTASHLDWIIWDGGVSQPDVDQLTDILRRNEQPAWKWTPCMRRCFRTLSHAVETERGGSSISRFTLGLNELFLALLDAAQMLREQPAAAVTDVALTYGFSSSQYFATVFSRRFGCSPREFRMKAHGAVTHVETSACGKRTT